MHIHETEFYGGFLRETLLPQKPNERLDVQVRLEDVAGLHELVVQMPVVLVQRLASCSGDKRMELFPRGGWEAAFERYLALFLVH